jgi:hypothetical protein
VTFKGDCSAFSAAEAIHTVSIFFPQGKGEGEGAYS